MKKVTKSHTNQQKIIIYAQKKSKIPNKFIEIRKRLRYNVHESHKPGKGGGWQNACSQAVLPDGSFIGRQPVTENPERIRGQARRSACVGGDSP